MYRSIEDIRSEYVKRANEYKTMRQAWEAVTIKTRKDGSEYKTLTKACLEGASIGYTYDGLKQLEVGGWSTGYVSDDIKIEEYGSSRATKYVMAPEEAALQLSTALDTWQSRKRNRGPRLHGSKRTPAEYSTWWRNSGQSSQRAHQIKRIWHGRWVKSSGT